LRIIFITIMFLSIVFAQNNTTIADTNNSLNETEVINLSNSIKKIDSKLVTLDFWIKYENYQKLLDLKHKLDVINTKIEKLKRKRRKTKQLLDEIDSLNLQKIAYQKQLEIMSGGKDNLFDSIISLKPLPKPFNITNPFGIFGAISYVKNLNDILDRYNKKYKELDEILALLHKKLELMKTINKNTDSLEKTIQDFELAKSIYYSKLTQLKTEANLYIQTMKDEEKVQINKLITLIVTIFISILFFTLVKLGFRKYANNLENIYLINKIINFLNFTVAVLIIAFFYIENATYLITILGFASAGIAIAMKDWFMNIFGWFVILITGNFKVGDRIKVVLQNGQVEIVGDVIDITATRIVIHEDVTLTTYDTNRRAGRIIFVPNNVIFINPIFNYTHNGLRAVWDGIDITITFDSNYKKAEYLAKEITKRLSKGYTDITRTQLNKLRNIYNIKNTQVEPRVFTFIGEYGIIISCWYLNNYAVLNLRSKISAEIFDAFSKEDDITIAYNTMNIKMKNEQINQIKTSL